MSEEKKRAHFVEFADRNHFADIEMPSEGFIAVVREAVPDGGWTDDEIDSVRDDVQFLFGKAVGQFNWSEFRTPRQELSIRLDLLERSLATAAEILSSSGHLRTKIDADLLSLILKASSSALGSESECIENQVVECDCAINVVLARVRIARKELNFLGGSGKPLLFWYEPIVEGAIELAKRLGIPLTTGGARSINPYETKFTCLVMGLEGFLPDEMRSDNLAACAKRIERSAVWKNDL